MPRVLGNVAACNRWKPVGRNQPAETGCSPGRSRCCSRLAARFHAIGGDGLVFYCIGPRFALTEIGAALVLIAIAALGWIGWRPLLRIAEVNFWSLNALAVQPGYALCREALPAYRGTAFPAVIPRGGRARLRAAKLRCSRHHRVRMCGIGCDPRLASLALGSALWQTS